MAEKTEKKICLESFFVKKLLPGNSQNIWYFFLIIQSRF